MNVNNLIKKRRATCKKLMQAHSLAHIFAAPHMPLVKEKHHINAWGQKGVKNVIKSKESKW
jgi:hypothetical protein